MLTDLTDSRWFQKCVKCWVFLHFCIFITHEALQSCQQSLFASDALWWIKLWKCTINATFHLFSKSAWWGLFKSSRTIEIDPSCKKSTIFHMRIKIKKIRIFQQFKQNQMELNETNRNLYKTLQFVWNFYCFSVKIDIFCQFQLRVNIFTHLGARKWWNLVRNNSKHFAVAWPNFIKIGSLWAELWKIMCSIKKHPVVQQTQKSDQSLNNYNTIHYNNYSSTFVVYVLNCLCHLTSFCLLDFCFSTDWWYRPPVGEVILRV